MLIGGQTLVILGTHLLPAGVASVFGSAAPIFIALFTWGIFRESLGLRQISGIGLGFAGLALMAFDTSSAGGFSPPGATLTIIGSASWAAGSLWARRLRLPQDPIVALAAQLVAVATVLTITVEATGIASKIDLTVLPAVVWGALAFLIIASTLVGYAVFLAVNAEVSSTIANTFNYAAPVIAMLLSASLLGERLSLSKLFAASIALSGVALMVRGPSTRQ